MRVAYLQLFSLRSNYDQ